MSSKEHDNKSEIKHEVETTETQIDVRTDFSEVASESSFHSKSTRQKTSSERQLKLERARKCLENAAKVSKRIKEQRKATAELLDRNFDEKDNADVSIDSVSLASEKTGDDGSVVHREWSVPDALSMPGISESLSDTLRQKEILMEKIKQSKARQLERSKKEKQHPLRRPSHQEVMSAATLPGIKETTETTDPTRAGKELQEKLKEKDAVIFAMQHRINELETNVVDLQDKCSEKDSLLEAKAKATSVMTENLSKKESDALSLLEDTKLQMIQMQENFLSMETEMKEEQKRLKQELENRNQKILHLEEANSILENFRIESTLAQSKLNEEILEKQNEIKDLQGRLLEYAVIVKNLEEKTASDSKEERESGEEKGSIEISNMEALTKKIELLEQLNCSIRQANIELETKLASAMDKPQAEETKPQQTPAKKAPQKQQPKRSKSTTRSPATKLKSPWTGMSEQPAQQPAEKEKKPAKSDIIKDDIGKLETVIQALNKELLDKECALSEKEIAVNEKIEVISRLETLLQNYVEEKAKMEELQSVADVTAKTAAYLEASQNVVKSKDGDNINVSPIVAPDEVDSRDDKETIASIQAKLDSALEQIASLSSELDAANKNMVKVKSSSKIKLKNLQKTIDNFSKMSDANAEIVKLNAEVNELSQRVAELEEDKGNLQLHLVDYDSGRLSDSQMFKKLTELEAMADIRLKAISELESQKFDLVQDLHIAQQRISEMEDKLADLSQLQSEHVCTAIASVQLEEQLDESTRANCKLEANIQNLKEEVLTLNNTISQVEGEKAELNLKLEHYIQENIDLTDRIEKLSTEKVSSAESIEIVESLTTQEKLEIEQYGQDINMGQGPAEPEGAELNESLIKLSQESAELNKKIELFTLERCEVMEKMDSMKNDNEELKRTIDSLKQQLSTLEDEKLLFAKDKGALMSLNEDVTQQIEILKKENIKLLDEKAALVSQKEWQIEDKVESVEISKESSEVSASGTDEKASSKAKNVKQLTKEILKLKNVIKEREGEIADCQMQILSMKELNTKQLEAIQGIQALEQKVKAFAEENAELKIAVDKNKAYEDNSSDLNLLADELQSQRDLNSQLQKRLDTLQSEYDNAVLVRDSKIQELEYLLQDNHQQVLKLNETLSHKDKEICEYLNQVSQLNSVSQKLKSTIEVLEEEKANDQNVELIRGLNKQITYLQNVIGEQELKIKHYEDDQKKLSNMKLSYEERVKLMEGEIRKLNESLMENDMRIKELQELKDNNVKDIIEFSKQCKEKDEEIHEIKLQLRRESIEHETLRKSLTEVNEMKEHNEKQIAELTANCTASEAQLKHVNESFSALEAKNKELMEKLKKFVVNLKKKSAMCVELETKVNGLNAELESKQLEVQNALSSAGRAEEHQVQVAALQNELEHVKRETANLNDVRIGELELKLQEAATYSSQLAESNAVLNTNLNEVSTSHENIKIQYEHISDIKKKLDHEQIALNAELERLNNRIADYEMEQKNSSNLLTKISALEKEIGSKQNQVLELLNKLDNLQDDYNNFKFGHEAKLQERDLYIENLETDIGKHQQRISRLEESISVMEDRRYSLERKADQLGSQLQEKQKAYTEYSNTEDELINRLAVLMDHDKVVEKQLHEIEKENGEVQNKLQKFIDENQQLQHDLGLAKSELNGLRETVNKTRHLEEEHLNATHKINDLESQLKKIVADQDKVLKQKQDDIEFLEGEFHIQIENAHKEKKSLSERCERLTEQLQSLERETVEEKAKLNAVLLENESISAKVQQYEWEKRQNESSPPKIDYTDDLVNEINNLQATIAQKNSENETLQKQVSQLQVARDQALARPPVVDDQALVSLQAALSEKEQEIEKLNNQFQTCLSQLRDASEAEQQLKGQYHELVKSLAEKDRMINDLTFRHNQMAVDESISSQMISSEQSHVPAIPMFDMSSLQDQIVAPEEIQHTTDDCDRMIRSFSHSTNVAAASSTPRSEKLKAASEPPDHLQVVHEDIIVPKKAYDCFDDDDGHKVVKRETAASQASAFFTETDPFNSDEGWGFGDSSTDVSEVPVQHSLLSQQETTTIIRALEEQVRILTESNEILNNDFSQCNTKLMKAMKKLKEFKVKNETIANELNVSKQLSQMNSLDMVIQEELSSQIKTLEEKVQGLQADSNKDKQEKQTLLNRIDVLTAANEKLVEIKEKLDNEVALWKFKFKELNDKLSSVEWGDERTEVVKSAPVMQSKPSYDAPRDSEIERLNLIIDGLEKENEDLNSLIEESRGAQKDLAKHSQAASQLQFTINKSLEEITNLQHQVAELTNKLDDLRSINNKLNGENSELKSVNDNLNIKYNEVKLQIENRDAELRNFADTQCNYNGELETVNARLTDEINEIRSLYDNLFVESSGFKDKCNDVQNEYDALSKEHKGVINEYNKTKQDLNEALSNLERSLAELERKEKELDSVRNNASKLEVTVQELEDRLAKLNEENGSLLSTVAELGSSVTTAVDQRGFEVAEMWKQHLSERETDFSQVEFELQKQLKASQEKYEQLLAHVQNTNLDEANKLVAVEQLSTLQDKLNDRDDQLQRLQFKFDEDLTQMEAMRSEMADEKILIENKLLAQQEEYEKQISDAEIKYKDLISEKDNSLETLSLQLSAALADDARRLTEIDSLNQKLNEFSLQQQADETKFKEIENKYREATSELEEVRRQLDDSVKTIEKLTNAKDESSMLLGQGDEHEKAINELELKFNNLLSEKDNQLQRLSYELAQAHTLSSENSRIAEDLSIARDMIVHLESRVQQSESTAFTLQKSVNELLAQCKQKETEIVKTDHDYSMLLGQKNEEIDIVRQQLVVAEKKVEDVTFEKESELASMRLRLHDLKESFERQILNLENAKGEIQEALSTKIEECKVLNNKIDDLYKLLEDETGQMADMRAALENQELEIVSLKDELEAVHAALRKNERHVTFSSDTKASPDDTQQQGMDKDAIESATKAELDLALYMLHQRDVRCEELTVELTHLLEERDTLQLRLSDALRACEDVRQRVEGGSERTMPEVVESGSSSSVARDSELLVGTHKTPVARTSSLSEADEAAEKGGLQNKLWELRSVSHRRDVQLRGEQERRYHEMALLQRDVAHMPPEAADRLRDAHFTLSRDSQSTSTVLLNWLRGKSTPKVVHM